MNARSRTAAHLQRLQRAAIATMALNTSCTDKGYGVVDPMPESYGDPCDDVDLGTALTAIWSGSATMLVSIDAKPNPGEEPTVSGGTLLSTSVDGTVWSGEIQPATDSAAVRLDFSLPCTDGTLAPQSVYLDATSPVEGASIPVSTL